MKHRILAILLLAACLLTLLPATAMAVPETETRSKGGKLIALTFDDGPGPYTRRLLEGLAKRGVKATFFMLGQQAENYDVTAGLVRDAGHQIASHTYDHPQLSKKTDSQVRWQISHTADILNRITGYGTHYLVRPPYGDYDKALIETVDSLGMSTIQWSVDSLDWKESATPDSIFKRVTGKVTNGSIVLFHNDADHTPEALPGILKCLKEQGYEFVFISDLILKDNYTIDHTGKQCPAAAE